MSTDHAIVHTHSHTHKLPRPFGLPGHTWVTHEHEHEHSSYRPAYATEGDPPHRMHFHTPKYDPAKAR